MYRELRVIERELGAGGSAARESILGRLDDLDRRARELAMPGPLNENAFTLRANIRAMRERVLVDQAAAAAS